MPAKDWTYDTQLKMAEAMFKAGYPIGFGCGQDSTDANQTWGATFGAFGADLVNAKGEITIESDNVMAAMEYCQKLVKFMPSDAVAMGRRLQQSRADLRQGRADLEPAFGLGGGQARCAAGRGGLLDLPQSDADRRAGWCRTGRISGGSGSSRRNKSAAKELIEYLSQREQVEQLAAPVSGYDIPPFTIHDGPQRLERRRAAEGHHLQLSGRGRGTTRNTTCPARRPLPRSRCRCGTAIWSRAWWDGC